MNILIILALALASALCSGSLTPPGWKMHICGVKGCVGATRRRASTPGEAEGAEITQEDQDLLLCVRKTAATAWKHQYSVSVGILLHWRTDISNPPKKFGFLQKNQFIVESCCVDDVWTQTCRASARTVLRAFMSRQRFQIFKVKILLFLQCLKLWVGSELLSTATIPGNWTHPSAFRSGSSLAPQPVSADVSAHVRKYEAANNEQEEKAHFSFSRSHLAGSCWSAAQIDALSRLAQFLPRQFIYIQSTRVIGRLQNRQKKLQLCRWRAIKRELEPGWETGAGHLPGSHTQELHHHAKDLRRCYATLAEKSPALITSPFVSIIRQMQLHHWRRWCSLVPVKVKTHRKNLWNAAGNGYGGFTCWVVLL